MTLDNKIFTLLLFFVSNIKSSEKKKNINWSVGNESCLPFNIFLDKSIVRHYISQNIENRKYLLSKERKSTKEEKDNEDFCPFKILYNARGVRPNNDQPWYLQRIIYKIKIESGNVTVKEIDEVVTSELFSMKKKEEEK